MVVVPAAMTSLHRRSVAAPSPTSQYTTDCQAKGGGGGDAGDGEGTTGRAEAGGGLGEGRRGEGRGRRGDGEEATARAGAGEERRGAEEKPPGGLSPAGRRVVGGCGFSKSITSCSDSAEEAIGRRTW